MALPAGITTCTVNVGTLSDFAGDSHEFTVEWQPVLDGKPSSGVARSIVWAATGDALVSFPEKPTPGTSVSFAVPHVDQPGFIDGTGGEVKNWAYRVTVKARDAARKTYSKTKVIQVFVGQTSVDFDMIPDGWAVTQTTAPTQWATQAEVDGKLDKADLDEESADLVATPGSDLAVAITAKVAQGIDDADLVTTTELTTGLGTRATSAQGAKADSAVQPAALATKADLVGGVVPTSQIPAIALTTGQVVANRAALLALTNVQEGDIGVISGTSDKGSYILGATPASVFGNWLLLSSPTDVVTTVNGQTGTVVLGKADVGLGNADNTSDASKPVSTAQAVADALRLALAGGTMADGAVIASSSTNGLKIGSSSTDRVGFFGATASPQRPGTDTVVGSLIGLGLRAAGNAFPGRMGYATSTSGVTLTTGSAEYLDCNATSGAILHTLPTTTTPGLIYRAHKNDSTGNSVGFTAAGSGSIAGTATLTTATQWATVAVISTSTSDLWRRL